MGFLRLFDPRRRRLQRPCPRPCPPLLNTPFPVKSRIARFLIYELRKNALPYSLPALKMTRGRRQSMGDVE